MCVCLCVCVTSSSQCSTGSSRRTPERMDNGPLQQSSSSPCGGRPCTPPSGFLPTCKSVNSTLGSNGNIRHGQKIVDGSGCLSLNSPASAQHSCWLSWSKDRPLGSPRSSFTRTTRSVPSMLAISILGPSLFQSAQYIRLK